MTASVDRQRVAVTGMGILCALGSNFDDVLSAMRAGTTGIGSVTRFPTERFHSGIGAELQGDAAGAFFTAEQRRKYDLCAQYAIIAADQAIQDSGLGLSGALSKGQRIGTALGTCNGGILSLEAQWTVTELDEEKTARYPFYQQGDDVAAYFGLNGPVTTIHTACAASGNAIGFAYDMIRWGHADAMLAGGSDPLSHAVFAGFNVLRALNPVPTSPFASRFGLSLGEGAAFVVLEPLDRALQRGANIYAELCGYGLSNDAHHETAPDPEGRGIHAAVEMALRQSGARASQIGYINAHGTGTQANDQAEIKGLHRVFGDELRHIPLSSSKAYFGHTLGAAAAIEFTTSLYAIRNGLLPATLHYDEPREGCEALRVIANDMTEGRPAYMLNNNSAFGGHNASIVARTSVARTSAVDDAAAVPMPYDANRRIGIVGIGTVLGGEILGDETENHPPGACSFSLKAFDASKYERRMNRLCQFSIGAVQAALAAAGWDGAEAEAGADDGGDHGADHGAGSGDDGGNGDESSDNPASQEIGFIYGTSRGSTESIGKFLHSVFASGPEFASSIHFPYTVINSIAGKTAEKLALRGFSSSHSSGGTEGILAAAYACGSIRSGVHRRFVIAAGEEWSPLSEQIDRAKGLTDSRYHPLEGSVCLAFADMDDAMQQGLPVIAELKGCGMAYGDYPCSQRSANALKQSIGDALAQAGLPIERIDGILVDSVGRPGEWEAQQAMIRQLLAGREVPVISLNEQYGFGESVSSMLLLSTAAEWVQEGKMRMAHMLAVSIAVNGNTAAAVVGATG